MLNIINLSKYFIIALLTSFLFINMYANEIVIFPKTEMKMNAYSSLHTPLTKNPESIWFDITQDFAINRYTNTQQVQKEIRNFLIDKRHLQNVLEASAPYIYYIYKETKANDLPSELALIPIIESEFNPYDKSTKGAAGIWQLMQVTAHQLGVIVKHGYDGRRNIVSSTGAALSYLKDLGRLFRGNWYLALAAYNSGQGVVLTAVRKAKHHNFWHLKLPKETKAYVPKLLALAEILKNPNKYHFKLPYISNSPYFALLTTNKSFNLNDAAKLTGVDIEILTRLNPDYAKGSNPGKIIKKTFLVPIKHENVAQFYLKA